MSGSGGPPTLQSITVMMLPVSSDEYEVDRFHDVMHFVLIFEREYGTDNRNPN